MGFEVDPAALRRHAGHLDTEGGHIRTAKSALDTGVSTDAFGFMCQFLATKVAEVGPDAQDAVAGFATASDNTADAVRGMAAFYEFLDILAAMGVTTAGTR